MNIAIIGYGKMGKEIESIALQRGHSIGLKINSTNINDLNAVNLKEIDVAIEFTTPNNVINNIKTCFQNNIPVVVGTTGWYNKFDEIKKECINNKQTLLYATNCSIGVNLFFKLNQQLAQMMNKYDDYEVSIDEIHHTQKLDSPSGTAITLAEGVIDNINKKTCWVEGDAKKDNELRIDAYREENVPGTHIIKYKSEIDTIAIKHEAHNRKGFAKGAVVAAEYIKDKKGIFTMNDVLFN